MQSNPSSLDLNQGYEPEDKDNPEWKTTLPATTTTTTTAALTPKKQSSFKRHRKTGPNSTFSSTPHQRGTEGCDEGLPPQPSHGHPQQEPPPRRQQRSNSSHSKASHSLSWLLRHEARNLGLSISSGGYVPVDEILQKCHHHPKLRNMTLPLIESVVQNCPKQRFRMEERPITEFPTSPVISPDTLASSTDSHTQTILCIRANQGHSIHGIDPEQLLNRISNTELASLPMIVHGTYAEPWKKIYACGYLSRMERNHIHFAAGIPGQDGVISGMRRTCQILIFVNGTLCARDGIQFYRSYNGVLLTDGIDGNLPLKYISHVTHIDGTIILDQRP